MSEKKLPVIYCSIDTTDPDHAMALSAAMLKAGCGIKLGLEFFSANGPEGIREIKKSYPELSLFIDLKFHDIPNTVAQAVRAVAPLEADFLTIHATGGLAMMSGAFEAMQEGAEEAGVEPAKLLGVTILTSLDEEAAGQAGFRPGLSDRVMELMQLSRKAGLSGIVCSPQEIEAMRRICGPGFVLMTPGIRPAGAARHDQKRVMAPEEALQKGATHLVIGRPITLADDPESAASAILKTIHRQAA